MSRGKGVTCGTCGLSFDSEEEFEKHVFHYKDYRWCGVKVLRVIEETPWLAELVNQARLERARDP